MRPLRVAAAALIGAAALTLTGCGQTDQVVMYKQGKYQGKPDTQPWNNAPLAYGDSKWTKGDKASWEKEINTRNLAQNEYRRIYNQ
jgi:hypothetical protein